MSSAKFQLALVTGATAGIGCAVSRLLARQGVTVVLVARSREKLANLSQEIEEGGGRSVVMECDLTKREDIVRMAASLKEKVGVPDLIINNAGAYCFQRLEDRDYDSWERMINLNIMAYLVVIAEFLGDMKVTILEKPLVANRCVLNPPAQYPVCLQVHIVLILCKIVHKNI